MLSLAPVCILSQLQQLSSSGSSLVHNGRQGCLLSFTSVHHPVSLSPSGLQRGIKTSHILSHSNPHLQAAKEKMGIAPEETVTQGAARKTGGCQPRWENIGWALDCGVGVQ